MRCLRPSCEIGNPFGFLFMVALVLFIVAIALLVFSGLRRAAG
jgi:hypothetical protein